MIVAMKRLALVCVAHEADRTLEGLRALGCLHVDLSGGVSPASVAAKERLSASENAVRILAKARVEAEPGVAAGSWSLEAVRTADLVPAVLALAEKRDTKRAEVESFARRLRIYAPFGDFDPAAARRLAAAGLAVALAKGPRDAAPPAVANGYAQSVGADARASYWVLVAQGTDAAVPEGFENVPWPAERLATVQARADEARADAAAATAALAEAWTRTRALQDGRAALCDAVDFAAARERLATRGELAWIEGWIPADAIPAVRARAVKEGWGLAFREAAADETPPTLIRPPKLFRPVAALFQGLGIAPAYVESDVSVPFMCYFSLFFAMLVGDGAYGAIFLALTLWGWRKTKPEPGQGHRPRLVRSWLALMTVFSTATVAWGLLSNTWFGAGIPWCADWPTVTWLADPSYNNMMLLCFSIGVSHLMLARIWNGLSKLNDTTCLAEFGWAGVLFTMYLVTNAIVGIFPVFPSWAYWVGGVSVALVFAFTVKPHELRTRGIELGMLPLNIMSALGDIISYVRLFAVGLASVKVAENFNAMATGFVQGEHAWWATALGALAMAAILLVGHGLNLAMAGLSILVHAVRLNTLEFSNHKGVSWAGYAYDPFKRN